MFRKFILGLLAVGALVGALALAPAAQAADAVYDTQDLSTSSAYTGTSWTTARFDDTNCPANQSTGCSSPNGALGKYVTFDISRGKIYNPMYIEYDTWGDGNLCWGPKQTVNAQTVSADRHHIKYDIPASQSHIRDIRVTFAGTLPDGSGASSFAFAAILNPFGYPDTQRPSC